MFEQDYVMRIIHEIVRTLLKLLFHIENPEDEQLILEDERTAEDYKRLLNLVAEGKIKEADHALFEKLNLNKKENFQMALLFYNYINDLDDEKLEAGGFSREQAKEGLLKVIKLYGYEDLVDVFLM